MTNLPPISLERPRSLAVTIADHLTDMIHAGDLTPGQRLTQTELATAFGVSRVAVRDALQHLRRRGLTTDIRGNGMVVRGVSCKAVRDLFAVRCAVEPLAARDACERLTDQDLKRLEQIIVDQESLAGEADLSDLVDIDWAFHEGIYTKCDNQLLLEVIRNLWSRARQARGLAQANVAWGRSWGRQSARRHRRILEALRGRDPATVQDLFVETITLAEEELVQGLQGAGWGEDGQEGEGK